MKLGMVARATLLTGALIALALAASSYWTFQRINPALEEKALDRLDAATNAAGLRLTSVLNGLRTDLMVLAASPPVEGLARLSGGVDPIDGSTDERLRTRLKMIIIGMLEAEPKYAQIRLIGVEDGGRELMRLERDDEGRIVTVRRATLQRKGGEDYFRDGIRLRPGEILLSEINLNREFGRIEEPHVPVIRATSVVTTPAGEVYGILVINLDLTRTFSEILAALGDHQQLFVTNEQGYFLVHPDESRTFGFELGHDARVQNELPRLASFLRGDISGSSMRLGEGDVVTVAERVAFDPERPDRFLLFALSALRSRVMATSLQTRNESLLVALMMVLFSVVCVVGLGRRVMRQMGGEPAEIEALAARVAAGDLDVDVGETSLERGGIYGSFRRMVGSLRERTERLETSEATTRAIVDNAMDAIITIDESGIVQSFNRAAETLFGYSASEVIDKNVRILMPEPHHSAHDGYLRNYRTTGERKIIGIARELKGKRKDGSLVPVTLRVGEAQIGSRTLFTGILNDISESLAAADALRSSNEELGAQNLFRERAARIAELSQGIWDLGSLANTVIAELARFVGAGAGVFYACTDGAGDEEAGLVPVGSYGRNLQLEASARCPGLVRQCARDRREILLDPVPSDYAPIESGVGSAAPLRVLLTPMVFAEEVRGVIELAAFEEFDVSKRALLEHVAVGLGAVVAAIADRTRIERLFHESQRLQEEAQTQAEELQASNEELGQKSEVLEEQRAQLEAQAEELRVANEEGEQRTEELRFVNEALTREKREVEAARSAIEEKSRDLEAASRYKSEFLANMSHELRTPLNSLLILAQSLVTNEGGNLSEDQVQCAQVIHEAGQDLLTLINDILDLSKVEAGRLDIVSAPVPTAQVAEAMRRQFGPTATQRNLDLHIEIAEGTPDEILTDVARVEQILRNLLSNACKFTSAGSVTLRIHPRDPATTPASPALASAPSVAFAVEDTGMGITLEKQEAIFEAFQQGDGSISRHFGGTGLGLTISRELARLLGGELHVRSESGQGSCFTLYLPVAGPPAAAEDPELAELPQGEAEPMESAPVAWDPSAEPEQLLADDRDAIGKRDKTILVIEDDLRFAEVVMERSRTLGYKCIAVGTASGALQVLSRLTPTAVVLDLGLPDMDGARVLEQLRNDPATAGVPLHVISARDETSVPTDGGAVRFTRKPVERDALDAILAELGRRNPEAGSRRVLLVDDVEPERRAIARLLADARFEVVEAESGAEATRRLRMERFDCVVLDFQLGDTTAERLLEEIRSGGGIDLPPVVIHTARDLSEEEHALLRSHAHAVVMKGADSTGRLLDEVSLFLHSVDRDLPDTIRDAPPASSDLSLVGRKVLLVDDDLRNTFALSRALRAEGLVVAIAENGEVALTKLAADPEIELVVMDMMMPVMDGLEATRRIRARKEWAGLPVIALTAGAMSEHRIRSLEAGVDEHLTKPVEMHQLLAAMRLWLSRA